MKFAAMTFNILCDKRTDAPYSWACRRESVAAVIQKYVPDILCVQEAYEHQKTFLQSCLPGYEGYGVGRNDGRADGEQVPVFHRVSAFDLLGQGHFWLSETPDVPGSIGWDAKRPRTAVWKTLRCRDDGMVFTAVNVHYDHVGQMANARSIDVIERMASRGYPMLLCGDFNAPTGSAAYQSVLGAGFADAAQCGNETAAYPTYTYHRFLADLPQDGKAEEMRPHPRVFRRIDHFFGKNGMRFAHCAVLDDCPGGICPSDHFPVFCKCAV